MAAPVRKYNPGFLTDDELVASFCIRTTEFEMLLEALRECTGPANQHQIVIGPRGSGKTTLLLRVAAEARRDPALAARCFPIVFAEESYEVSTAGEFWLECLTLLAAQTPHGDDEPDLHRTAEELRAIRDDRALADRCLGALMDFADRHDQRLLLLVENLNMLFRDMTDRDAGWRLRKVLQTEPRIILFASATSRFREIDHPEHALYDLFRIRTLRPLDTRQCEILWNAVAGRTPPTATIRSLEILTGGNPRLLAIVARFGAARSFRQLMADLLDLVDDHTEYFKSHVDSLAAQERRVYLALAALWKPATTREIADHARLDTNTCSAQLARLGAHGAVQVTGGSARRKQYYLTERLYNIYYLLRRQRGPDRLVEALIRFMESYYSPDDLKEIAVSEFDRLVEDPDGLIQPLYQNALEELLASPILAPHREELEAMRRNSTQDREAQLAAELLKEVYALVAEGRMEDALATCDKLARRFADSKSPIAVRVLPTALVLQGTILSRLDRLEDALAVLDLVVERFGDSLTPTTRRAVAIALVNKAPALIMLNRPKDALAVCSQVVARCQAGETPKLNEFVAQALAIKGIALRALKRPKDVLAACDEVVRRFGASETPILSEWVAIAFMNKLAVLKTLNRPREALAAYDDVVGRFARFDFPHAQVGIVVTEALLERATAIFATGDRCACERDVQEALSRLGDKTPLSLLSMGALMELSVDIGPQRMSELIRESPAQDLLLPLTTALERELGNEPRVALEVEEVAQDIRRQLKGMREKREERATQLGN